jgi:hypothetical protein
VLRGPDAAGLLIDFAGICILGRRCVLEDNMKANVGSIDRIIRGVAGVALIAWAVTGGPWWAWIGVVPLATAIFAWCPLYAVFGIATCAKN